MRRRQQNLWAHEHTYPKAEPTASSGLLNICVKLDDPIEELLLIFERNPRSAVNYLDHKFSLPPSPRRLLQTILELVFLRGIALYKDSPIQWSELESI